MDTRQLPRMCKLSQLGPHSALALSLARLLHDAVLSAGGRFRHASVASPLLLRRRPRLLHSVASRS
jgi:hypothetical protein